jgi:tryptophan synthase alpha chain
MTRIEMAFRSGRKLLIGYLTAGDPSAARTVEHVHALARGGVDLIELGVPFSDPIADGPVIQAAAERALTAGTTLAGVLDMAREIRRRSEIPLLLFSYMNPAVRFGFARLAAEAKEAGIDGCLMTDLSVEEADNYVRVMRGAGLDTVFLAAPTSSDRRLQLVAKYSTGFIYCVSRAGVTGEQDQLSASAAGLIARIRQHTDLPLALGFGISRPEQAREAASLADGVVVGSAIMRMVEADGDLEAFARGLRRGMDTPDRAAADGR